MGKVALITGMAGQDGFYLARLLLEKGYEVHGTLRHSSLNHKEILEKKYGFASPKLCIHYIDMTDFGSILSLMQAVQPDEVYNLAAQSHVGVSFETAEYTANVNALGTLRILEAIRILGLAQKTRFYQASTSELFGKVQEIPQNEATPFYPRSPYAVAKLYGHWITVNYREAYEMYACSGILFNHESPIRGETFVTRKITQALSRIYYGLQDCLYLGNLDTKRDWGHAKDYVYAQWLMLQQDKADDFVIATGQQHSVREFAELVFSFLGLEVRWEGEGVNECGFLLSYSKNLLGDPSESLKIGDCIVRVDSRYFRPAEVDTLLGSASHAHKKLKWKPSIAFESLVEEMLRSDCIKTKRERSFRGEKSGLCLEELELLESIS